MIRKLDEEIKKYDEIRVMALHKHGTKREDGTTAVDETGKVMLTQANMHLFAKELNDLNTLDVDIGTITVHELGDAITMSPAELMVLEGLIV